MGDLVSAVLLAVWLAAGASAAPKNPDTLVVSEIAEMTTLDWAFSYDAVSQGVLFNVYDTLIAFKGESLEEIAPRLATQVPSLANGLISKDGRAYRFPIRKGARFHDGSAITPEDARYSLLRFMLSDRAGGPSVLLLEPILGVSSTRDSTGTVTVDFAKAEKAVRVEGDDLVITLDRPFGPFLSVMARWSYVAPKAWAAANGEWDGRAETWKSFNNPEAGRSYFHEHANGSGPFRLERWDKTGRSVVLTRFDGYWGKPAGMRRVLVKAVPEFATRRLTLEAGDADIVSVPRPFISSLQGLDGVRILDRLKRLATDPCFFFTFKINTAGNPDVGSGRLDGDGIPGDFFSDKDVRKGLAYAFDYDALLRDTFKGTAIRARGAVPPGLLGYDVDQPFYKFDMKQAERHFRKAWGGKVWDKGFRFTLTYNVGGEVRESACQILKKNVEKLNPKFRVDLRGLDWAAFLDKGQKRMLPLFSRGWTADYPDAHNFVQPFYHSAGRYPSAQGYADPKLDALIDASVREVDPKKRAALYRQVLRIAHEEVPTIVTAHPTGVAVMRDWVRGFYDNPVNLGMDYRGISK